MLVSSKEYKNVGLLGMMLMKDHMTTWPSGYGVSFEHSWDLPAQVRILPLSKFLPILFFLSLTLGVL